ncbi:SAM-dependent methyltransferase [Endozoicomonas arenosclerae]|uniref:SAM-dependent methyltransferase n=1 Tax=Endozoicomonas arenosclerae TaxID=1633495 RepID=UPI000785C7FA|nr:SAM-dependent methyltransferase [Endozoicomonas arenosclerae]
MSENKFTIPDDWGQAEEQKPSFNIPDEWDMPQESDVGAFESGTRRVIGGAAKGLAAFGADPNIPADEQPWHKRPIASFFRDVSDEEMRNNPFSTDGAIDDYGDAQLDEAAEWQPEVASYKDVNGLGSGVKYIGERLANSAPYMAALATGNPAAFGAITLSNTGDIVDQQEERGEEKNLTRAAAAGLGSTVLESIVPRGVAGLLKEPVKQGVAKTIAKGALGEGLTEVAQETATEYGVSGDVKIPENWDEAFVAGAAMGGTMTGAGQLAGKMTEGRRNSMPSPSEVAESARQQVKEQGGDALQQAQAASEAAGQAIEAARQQVKTDGSIDYSITQIPEHQPESEYEYESSIDFTQQPAESLSLVPRQEQTFQPDNAIEFSRTDDLAGGIEGELQAQYEQEQLAIEEVEQKRQQAFDLEVAEVQAESLKARDKLLHKEFPLQKVSGLPDSRLESPAYREYLSGVAELAHQEQVTSRRKNLPEDETVLMAIRRLKGVRAESVEDTIAESLRFKVKEKELKGLPSQYLRKNGGMTLDDMATAMYEDGFQIDGREMTVNELSQAIDNELAGRPMFADFTGQSIEDSRHTPTALTNRITAPAVNAALKGEELSPTYRREVARLLDEAENDPIFQAPEFLNQDQARIEQERQTNALPEAWFDQWEPVDFDYINEITGLDTHTFNESDWELIAEAQQQLVMDEAAAHEQNNKVEESDLERTAGQLRTEAETHDNTSSSESSSQSLNGVEAQERPGETAKPEVASAKSSDGIVSQDEYHLKEAQEAFQHSNRSAAKSYSEQFINDIQDIYNESLKLAETDQQKAALQNAITQYKQDYLKAEKDYFQVRSGVASSHIAGRDKFNVRQAEKRSSADDKAHQRMVDAKEFARVQVKKAVLDARSTEQVEQDQAKQQADRKKKAFNQSLKELGGLVGEVAEHLRSNRETLAKDTRKWAMPEAFQQVERLIETDRPEAIKVLKKLDELTADVGGLVNVVGARSKLAKLYKELNSEKKESLAPSTQSGKSGDQENKKADRDWNKATLEHFIDAGNKALNGELPADQHIAAGLALLENKEAVKAELEGMSKKAILQANGIYFEYQYRNEKKARVVNAAYWNLVKFFNPNDSISFGFEKGAQEAAYKRVIESVTQEKLDTLKAKREASKKERAEKKEARKKALDNPETLEEFKYFIEHKGVNELTPDQLEQLDSLTVEARLNSEKEQDTKKSEVSGISGDTAYTTAETTHAKKGIPLYVVSLDGRVDKERFNEVRDKAKALGGWYSSFRKNGAIPGFQFESEEVRQQFLNVLSGESESSGRIEHKKQSAQERRVEKLRQMADDFERGGENALNADRKTNTAKRAREAASAIKSAEGSISHGRLLRQIADAAEQGIVKLLSRINANTQINELLKIRKQLKWRAVWEKSDLVEEIRGEEIRHEWKPDVTVNQKVAGAEFDMEVASSYLKNVAEGMENTGGYKLTGKALTRILNKNRQEKIDLNNPVFSRHLDKIKAFARDHKQWHSGLHGKDWDTQRAAEIIHERFLVKHRLAQIGIKGVNSLRFALRELYEVEKGIEAVKRDRLKEMELELVGQKFPGFFPTPEPVVKTLIDHADIQPGMSVLEPSAGKGDIADGIRKAEPESEVTVIEIQKRLRDYLEARGFNPEGMDFLEHVGEYDRIVMNPPFEEGQDMQHVHHAFDQLKPGGRLVAVMSAMSGDRQRKQDREFSEWVEEQGGVFESLPEGAFKSSFRPTGVNTKVLILDKSGSENRYRLGSGKGIKHSSARFIAGKARKQLGVDVQAVSSEKELPENLQSQIKSDGVTGNVKGLFDTETGTAYIIASNLSDPHDAVKTILHEVVGHKGVRQALGNKLNLTMAGIYRDIPAGARQELESRYQEQLAGLSKAEQKIRIAEEYVAGLAETNPKSGLLFRMISKVKSILRTIAPGLKWSHNDVVSLIQEGKSALRKAGGSEVKSLYSLSDKNPLIVSPRQLIRKGRLSFLRKKMREQAQKLDGESVVNESTGERIWFYKKGFKHSASGPLDKHQELAVRLMPVIPEIVKKAVPFDRQSDKKGRHTISEVIKLRTKIQLNEDHYFVDLRVRKYSSDQMQRLYDHRARKKDPAGIDGDHPHNLVIADVSLHPTTGPNTTIDQRKTEKFEDDDSNRYSLSAATGGQQASTPFVVSEENWRDTFIRKIQDKYKPLKRTQDAVSHEGLNPINEDMDAYLAEELSHGKMADELRQFERSHKEPLAKAIALSSVNMDELDLYLYAKHAPERNTHIAKINNQMPDGGSGMTNNQAKSILDRFDQEGKTAVLQSLADRVYRINKQRIQLLRSNGLEKDEALNSWARYQHYVPLKGRGDQLDDASHRQNIGSGFDVRGKESMRALGRRSMAESPTLHSLAAYEESIVRKGKNEVGQTFLKLVEANPNKDYWEVFSEDKLDSMRMFDPRTEQVVDRENPFMKFDRDSYFAVKRDGKEYYIKLKDQQLLEAMHNLGPEKMGQMIRTLSTTVRALALVNTSINPEFVISNFSRDIQTAVLNVVAEQDLDDGRIAGQDLAKQVIKDVPVAMRGVWRNLREVPGQPTEYQQWFDDFQADGGKIDFFGLTDFDSQKSRLGSLIEMESGTTKGELLKRFHNLKDLVEDANAAVENAVRLSAYVNARKAGISRKKAASLAKNLTVNFNRKGELGVFANALYMFFNAGVQGTAQFARVMKSRKAQKIAGGLVASSVAIAEINRILAGEDDDGENWWDKVPGHVKERNLVLMKPGREDGSYWTVPLPYGYNVFHVTGNLLDDLARDQKSIPEASGEMVKALLGSFNPIGLQDSKDPEKAIIKSVSPTILSPIVQLAVNENFYGAPIYRDGFPGSTPRPDSAQAMKSTKDHFKVISQWLNEVTGGTDYRSGWMDISPDSIEHIAEFATGGVGAFGSRSLNALNAAMDGKFSELEDREIPFWRKLNGKVSEYQDIRTFYERLNDASQYRDEYRSLPDRLKDEYREEFGGQIRAAAIGRKFKGRISKIRERMERIENSSRSDAEKEAALDKLQERLHLEVDRFNKRYAEMVED